MPASYTHQCFGDDVLPRLSTMIQRIISSHKDYYDLGLQGPDLFFYYHPTRKTLIRDFGLSLHKENAYSFFEEKIAYLHTNQDEEMMSYLFGFINHYLLDSYLHPLIMKHDHFACERDLDYKFIKEHKPKNRSVADHFSSRMTLCKKIGLLLHMEPILIQKSIRSFQFYGAILYNHHKPILRSAKLLLKLMHLPNANMVMIDSQEVDHTISEHYDECVKDASLQLENVYYAIIHGESLSSTFNKNYYGK